MGRLVAIILTVLGFSCALALAAVVQPMATHPGNIFVQGEGVTVALAAGTESEWEAVNSGGTVVAHGKSDDGKASLGVLPVGYYEVRRKGGPRVTVGVVAPLVAATPADSPIAADVAMSWFYPDEATEKNVANICNLAGLKWVRDRMSWPAIEPKPGEFVDAGVYDRAAKIQTDAGLHVLQVNHIGPAWQKDTPKQFPNDLRDAYRFYREIARHWKGQVLAIEPWNEADIEEFGGHTGSEMAAMQKASYLGLKAGNPDVIACLNVFAKDQTPVLDDYYDNEAWGYIDTYNFHHYCGIEKYAEVYANHRRVSAGRPMWVTECNIPVQWTGDPKLKEPSDQELRVQARRVARVYAASIFNGAKETFYFILGDYVERQTQYGALHADLTPRPAFLAIAAAGRLMAGAKPLGQWKPNEQVEAYVFRAMPDGVERDVIVGWTRKGMSTVDSKLPITSAFGCLGHPLRGKTLGQIHFNADPIFVVLPKGSAEKLPLDAPPKEAEFRKGEISNVVLQALLPSSRIEVGKSTYTVSSNRERITVYAYNFGDKPVHGVLSIKGLDDWHATVPETIDIEPGGREEITVHVTPTGTDAQSLKISGDFGAAGHAVVSLRLLPQS